MDNINNLAIVTELTKLTKGDLIDLITQGKLPLGKLKDDNVLLSYDVSMKLNNKDDTLEINGETRGLAGELLCCLKQQIENLNELVSDKNKIIKLLNEKIDSHACYTTNATVNNQIKTAQWNAANKKELKAANLATAPVNSANTTSKLQGVKLNKQQNISVSDVANCLEEPELKKIINGNKYVASKASEDVGIVAAEDSEGPYQTVSRKRSRKPKKAIVGLATESSADFAGANSRCWLYISRVSTAATEDSLRNFLNGKLPNHTFECTKLSTFNNSTSFKVGADISLHDALTKPEFWPKNINVRRFNFFRGPRNIQPGRNTC